MISFVCFAQEESYRIPVSTGDYFLLELLEQLRSQGVPIAYSSDKLPNSKVHIKEHELLSNFLRTLQRQKLLNFSFLHNQYLLSPYIKKSYTLHGVLRDIETGEHIIGATVYIENTKQGVITNKYGHYSLTLPAATYQLVFSHVSYKKYTTTINLSQNIDSKIGLVPYRQALDSLEVSGSLNIPDIDVSFPNIDRLHISVQNPTIPYLLGEVDVTQTAITLPGIHMIGEDASGLNIRGGSVDQNLNLLDEVVIYNPNHFYGLISVFNPETVNNIKINKGFIPPGYGGRSSATIEVQQKEGNKKEKKISGGLGLISARLTVDAPIVKDKSSLLVSVRQSLINPIFNTFNNTSSRKEKIRFQDANLKLNMKPNPKNTYYLSGYYGNDRSTSGLSLVRNWGNRLGVFRWNHLFSSKWFSNFSFYGSRYNYQSKNEETPGAFVETSYISDFCAKFDISYFFNPESEIDFGVISTLHRLVPGVRIALNEDINTAPLKLENEHAIESAVYAGHQFDFSRLSLHYGFRFSSLHNVGKRKVFVYEPNQVPSDEYIIDTLFFGNGKLIKYYGNWEPRIGVNYRISPLFSAKAAYTKNTQYIHLISNTITPLPTDIWKLSDTYIPPNIVHQYTVGLYHHTANKTWEFNLETYYKKLLNNIRYKNGADLIFNENIETELFFQNGRAYGIELYVKKHVGKITGQFAYTFSRAENILNADITQQYIPTHYDKTHALNLSCHYTLSSRMSLSSNFIINTGVPFTLPTDKYKIEGHLIPHFEDTEYYNFRLPTYHRLDISLQIRGKQQKRDESPRKNTDSWIITLYNLYARKNPNSYFFRTSASNSEITEIVQYSIFGTIIPSLTYNFKF